MVQSVLLINASDFFSLDALVEVAPGTVVSVITVPEFSHRYADVVPLHVVDSLYDLGGVSRAATAVYQSQGIDLVIGASEKSIPAAGFVRSSFGLPGYGFDTALACSNKHLMKRRLRAAGLPVTDWHTVPTVERVPDAMRSLGATRAVVKPVFGSGSERVHVADSVADAESSAGSERWADLSGLDIPVIVERFVDIMAEYQCDGVVWDGEVRFAAVGRYHRPLLEQIGTMGGSCTVPADAAEFHEITELYRRAVKALGLASGITHMELFQTKQGFLVGEITCRPGGAGTPELIRRQYGVDMWRAFTELSVGIAPELTPRTRERTFAWADLPIRGGRVTALSSEAELAAVPDVVDVEMLAKVGDVVGEGMNCATTTGRVYFGLKDVADLPSRLDELASAYTFAVEPADVEV
jgi:hypothetical protein